MTDGNKPSSPFSSIYRGVLWDGSTRVACTTANCVIGGISEHDDSVLSPSRTYVRGADAVTMANTNILSGTGATNFTMAYSIACGEQ